MLSRGTPIKSFLKALDWLGQRIATLVNMVLLALVYVVGVGLAFLLVKLIKKRLFAQIDHTSSTYWQELDKPSPDRKGFYKQF